MHICGTSVELLGRAERSQCLISGAPKGLDGEGADRAMILSAAIPLAIGQCPIVPYQFFAIIVMLKESTRWMGMAVPSRKHGVSESCPPSQALVVGLRVWKANALFGGADR